MALVAEELPKLEINKEIIEGPSRLASEELKPAASKPFRLISPKEPTSPTPLVSTAENISILPQQDENDNLPRPFRKRKTAESLSLPTRHMLDRTAKQMRFGHRMDVQPQAPPVIVPNQQALPYRFVAPEDAQTEKAAKQQPPTTTSVSTKLDVLPLQREAIQNHTLHALAEESDAHVEVSVRRDASGIHVLGMGSKAQGPKPQLQSGVLSATPFTWAPGMTCVNGITYVNPTEAADGAPPPATCVGVPARWKPPKKPKGSTPTASAPAKPSVQFNVKQPASSGNTDTDELMFAGEGDTLLDCIQYIKAVASIVGRLPNPGPPNAEMRRNQALIAHALLARDGRLIEKPRHLATRRSSRARQTDPLSSPAKPARRPAEDVEVDPAALTDVRIGHGYQSALPVLRQRSEAPTKRESRFLGEAVTHPGDVVGVFRDRKGKRGGIAEVESAEERAKVVKTRWTMLANELGPVRSAHFGLGTMGANVADTFTVEEQEGLYNGMHKYNRNFFKIATEFVPTKTATQLSAYYYDVWKMKLVPAAQKWYDDKEAKKAAAIAAAEEEERQRELEAIRRAERQEATNKRRMLREAVNWVKNSARTKLEDIKWNKNIVRERASRIINLLRDPNRPLPEKEDS